MFDSVIVAGIIVVLFWLVVKILHKTSETARENKVVASSFLDNVIAGVCGGVIVIVCQQIVAIKLPSIDFQSAMPFMSSLAGLVLTAGLSFAIGLLLVAGFVYWCIYMIVRSKRHRRHATKP